MAILDSSNDNKPTSIRECKRTYVVAKGRATADGATASAAVKDATAEAKN